MDFVNKYAKAFVALAGALIPMLNGMGVPLPEFLTVDWLNTMLLVLTPILVIIFPNKVKGDNVMTTATHV